MLAQALLGAPRPMPSFSHEAPLTLIRERPELVVHLLREVLHIPVPRGAEPVVDTSDHTDLGPIDRRADLVVTLRAPPAEGGREARVVMGIIVEAQLRPSAEKHFVWPHYAAGLHDRLRAPVWLLVLAADEATAAWARRPIATFQPSSPFVPLVVGPAELPAIRSIEEARRLPELAVLSAMAHGNEANGLDVVHTAVEALVALEPERKLLYFDMIHRALNEAARRALEHDMRMHNYEWSDWAKEQQAIGRAAGQAIGQAQSVLSVLAARTVDVPPDIRDRILATRDLPALDRLIRRAVTVARAEDLFAAD